MTDQIDSLRSRAAAMSASLVDMVQAAYDAGFRDGGLAMRDHILQAANAPVAIKAGSVSHADPASTAARDLERSVANLTSAATGLPSWQTYTARPAASSSPTDHSPAAKRVAARAPRGLVRTAVEAALTERPGSSITELEDVVVGRHPEIARKSVGNQLRHFEGELYRREGKYQWFLMGDAHEETATPGIDPDIADLLGQTERR